VALRGRLLKWAMVSLIPSVELPLLPLAIWQDSQSKASQNKRIKQSASILYCSARWNNTISRHFVVGSGVRQGS